MSDSWSLRKRESKKVYNDLPFSTIKTWIVEGRIQAHDYVNSPQLGKWVKVSSLKSLQQHFSSNKSDVVSSRDVRLGWRTSQSEEDDANVDLTPMIDVTFLLLIFFMVTATFAVHEVVNVKVPKAKNTVAFKEKKLVVTIDITRKIYVGKQQVAIGDLKAALAQRVSQTLQQDVLLAADHKLSWGFIVTVLDEIKGSGIEDVKLKLEKKKR